MHTKEELSNLMLEKFCAQTRSPATVDQRHSDVSLSLVNIITNQRLNPNLDISVCSTLNMQNYLKSFSPKGKGVDVNEISFAKQFLTAVDQKPLKLSSDHVEDARKLPAQPAVSYCLP